jgi:hypothetical protein
MALPFLFIVLELIYNFAATWVARNIWIQRDMLVATGLLAIAAIISRIFVQQKVSPDLADGKAPEGGLRDSCCRHRMCQHLLAAAHHRLP